jgi:hypothetical protein
MTPEAARPSGINWRVEKAAKRFEETSEEDHLPSPSDDRGAGFLREAYHDFEQTIIQMKVS